MAFTKASSPGPGRAWRGGFMVFSVLYNMHHEGFSPGPSRAWGGAFMAFKLAKVLVNSHATHGSCLALINCIVADHSQLCYTMKAPLQALEGPGEEPSWHLPFHGIYRSFLSRPFQGLERRLHRVFLLGALCYTICTMKAPPQGLGRSLYGI